MVARQTLTLFVWVQILDPQPKRLDEKDDLAKKPTVMGFFVAHFAKNTE